MDRDERLSAAYTAWLDGMTPHTRFYLSSWDFFRAGANAAMDLQFEPGAVRFGEPLNQPSGDPCAVVHHEIGGEG